MPCGVTVKDVSRLKVDLTVDPQNLSAAFLEAVNVYAVAIIVCFDEIVQAAVWVTGEDEIVTVDLSS